MPQDETTREPQTAADTESAGVFDHEDSQTVVMDDADESVSSQTAASTQPSEKKSRIARFFSWSRGGKKPVEVSVARREDGRDVSIAQLKQGYSEVVDTMKAVRNHLDEQSDRSDQMLELLRGLPEVLQSIPEANRNQSRVLEAIHGNLERQNETSHKLSDAITGLTDASGSQREALTQIRDHLSEEDQSRTQLNDGVAALNGTLGHVMDASAATRDAMGTVVDQARLNDEHMRTMFRRSQKMNTAMMLLCLALTIGALALAGYVAYMVSQMPAATAG